MKIIVAAAHTHNGNKSVQFRSCPQTGSHSSRFESSVAIGKHHCSLLSAPLDIIFKLSFRMVDLVGKLRRTELNTMKWFYCFNWRSVTLKAPRAFGWGFGIRVRLHSIKTKFISFDGFHLFVCNRSHSSVVLALLISIPLPIIFYSIMLLPNRTETEASDMSTAWQVERFELYL